jgi:hypothetical protein
MNPPESAAYHSATVCLSREPNVRRAHANLPYVSASWKATFRCNATRRLMFPSPLIASTASPVRQAWQPARQMLPTCAPARPTRASRIKANPGTAMVQDGVRERGGVHAELRTAFPCSRHWPRRSAPRPRFRRPRRQHCSEWLDPVGQPSASRCDATSIAWAEALWRSAFPSVAAPLEPPATGGLRRLGRNVASRTAQDLTCRRSLFTVGMS